MVFSILSAIKPAKFHLPGDIITEVSLFGYAICFFNCIRLICIEISFSFQPQEIPLSNSTLVEYHLYLLWVWFLIIKHGHNIHWLLTRSFHFTK